MSMPSLARAIAAAVLSLSALAPSGAVAQNFERPVRLIVPFAPGGTSDILARLISPKLSVAIGQSVVVENKPGAAGNLGADAVAKAQPDGHTLLLMDVASLATARQKAVRRIGQEQLRATAVEHSPVRVAVAGIAADGLRPW